MRRIVAVVQARMGSTRLPGKTLADLGGAPVIDRVVDRAAQAKGIDAVVVATTNLDADDCLARHLQARGVRVVRGSNEDVLSRYVLAAEECDASAVVRVTADCPFIEPTIVDAVVARYESSPPVDYCSNVLVRTYPIGMDCEVVSRSALLRAHACASTKEEREHVTPHIYQHPEVFRLRNVEAEAWARQPQVRLTIDEEADLRLAREIVGRLGPEASLRAVLGLLERHPYLAAMNSSVQHRHMAKPRAW